MHNETKEIFDILSKSMNNEHNFKNKPTIEFSIINNDTMKFFGWGDGKEWQTGYITLKKQYDKKYIYRAVLEFKKEVLPNLSFSIPQDLLITDENMQKAIERFMEIT